MGFGKTTLVAAWAAQAPHLVAWLALDEHDNNPALFLTLHLRFAPHAVAALHRQASTWLAHNNLIDEALDHALAAGDTAGAARVVIDYFVHRLGREDWRAVERWLELLPEAAFDQYPWLLIVKAHVVQIQSNWTAVSHLLQEAETRLAGPAYTVGPAEEATVGYPDVDALRPSDELSGPLGCNREQGSVLEMTGVAMSMAESSETATCVVQIQGALDRNWAAYLGDLAMITQVAEDQTTSTFLSGQVMDFAAFVGLIAKLQKLGLPVQAM